MTDMQQLPQMMDKQKLPQIIEAILLASGKALNEKQILNLFPEEDRPNLNEVRQALYELRESCQHRGVELYEVASGFQFQVKSEFVPWLGKLWEEKPARYSRALLETLALIAYRQPITRGEIEEIRGVSVSSSIFKTLLEDRGWIRVVGHKDVPGRPGLYATTKEFLDYFGLKSLEELPSLSDVMNIESVNMEMDLDNPELPSGVSTEAKNDESINNDNQAAQEELELEEMSEEELEAVAEEEAEELDEDDFETVAEDEAEELDEDDFEAVAEDETEELDEDEFEAVAEDEAEELEENNQVKRGGGILAALLDEDLIEDEFDEETDFNSESVVVKLPEVDLEESVDTSEEMVD